MSQCQCIKKSGQQCKLNISKKEGADIKFCHVHQGCTSTAVVKPTTVIQPKQGPNRTEKEQAILDWLTQTILEVVMTPGGGLYTVCYEKNPQPQQTFANFTEYEDWVLKEIFKVKISGMDPDHEDYRDQYYDLFSKLCPMFDSSKDDGGRMYEKAMELMGVIDSS